MSISTAMLSGKWEVEFHAQKKKFTLEAGNDELIPQCNSWCKSAAEIAVNARTGVSESAVSVEAVHLAGRFELGIFTISMFDEDLFGGLKLTSPTEPFLGKAAEPNFWLEGKMTIKVKLAGMQKVVSLVSRNPVLQTGRATSWPPYNTTMRDVSGPNEYVQIDDAKGPPVLTLWSGSITIGNTPSPFLSADITVNKYEYLFPNGNSKVSGVRLHWNDERTRVPQIEYYHVYRRHFAAHYAPTPWERVGGNIAGAEIVDPKFDGTKPTIYKVRQMYVDVLGDECKGCGNETEFTVPAVPANLGQLRSAGFSV